MFNPIGPVQGQRKREPGLTILYAIDRLAQRLTGQCCVYPYAFYAQPVPPESALEGRMIDSLPGTLNYEILTADDDRLEQFGIDPAARAFRFDQNAKCLCLGREDRIEALMWYVRGPFNEDEVFCRYQRIPEDTTVWDFGVEVRPKLRNTKMFARIWALANRELRKDGVTHSFSRISRFNDRSIRSHESLGAEYVGKATFFRIGRLQVMVANLPPYFHVTFTGKRPTLTFRIDNHGKRGAAVT